MPTRGDRVVFEGTKVGGGRREGELVSIDGRAVRVRWDDGNESLMFPGPGAMRVVEPAGSGIKRSAQAKSKPAAKAASKKTGKAKKKPR